MNRLSKQQTYNLDTVFIPIISSYLTGWYVFRLIVMTTMEENGGGRMWCVIGDSSADILYGRQAYQYIYVWKALVMQNVGRGGKKVVTVKWKEFSIKF